MHSHDPGEGVWNQTQQIDEGQNAQDKKSDGRFYGVEDDLKDALHIGDLSVHEIDERDEEDSCQSSSNHVATSNARGLSLHPTLSTTLEPELHDFVLDWTGV